MVSVFLYCFLFVCLCFLFVRYHFGEYRCIIDTITLRLTVFEIFAVNWPKFKPKIWDLGILLGEPPPNGEKTVPGRMCTIMQNFTAIGVTVAEISVTG